MERPGGALNGGNNLCNTVLSDAGTSSLQAVTAAQAPYTGTFRPANPLAAFEGEDPNRDLDAERVRLRGRGHRQRARLLAARHADRLQQRRGAAYCRRAAPVASAHFRGA